MTGRTEHAQSTLDDAAAWREVVRNLVECGMDPRTITPELIISVLRRNLLRVGADYVDPAYTGYACWHERE